MKHPSMQPFSLNREGVLKCGLSACGKPALACFVVLFGLIPVASAQVPRADVVECGLPDGSQFELRSKYTWYPSAHLIPYHLDDRKDQQDFSVRYVDRTDRIIDFATRLPANRISEESGAADLCASLGYSAGLVFAPSEILILGRPRAVVSKGSPFQAEIKQQLDAYLAERGFKLFDAVTYFLRADGSLIAEYPLGPPRPATVEAALHLLSLDGGASWRWHEVGVAPQHFGRGESPYEQPFVARPLSLNGKRFESTHAINP